MFGFVTQQGLFPYSIGFENDPKKATAPAQDVTVTEQLDANLDWSTFALGDIQFGATTITVPGGLQSFQTSVNATNMDGTPLRVDVSAGLNQQTGVVTWTFLSVDPVTGLAPSGIVDGFLPVDDSTGRGQAFVHYVIRAKAGLGSGKQFTAQATVVFDTNPALATNTASNTIDAGPPTSSVQGLPATEPTGSFAVTWAGQDDAGGSGVASYSVFVSDNGGPFTLWQNATTQTSAIYPGQVGHTYAFYSVATDNVGHVQATPAVPQATTRVQPPTSAPPSVQPPATTSGSQSVTAVSTTTQGNLSSRSAVTGQPVTYTLTVAAGSATPPGSVTLTGLPGGARTLPLNDGTVTFTFAAPPGRYALQAAFLGDTNFQPSSGPTAVLIVQTSAREPDPRHKGKFVLVVGTTSGRDHIRLQTVHGGREIQIDISQLSGGHFTSRSTFAMKGLSGILIYGQRGTDPVQWLNGPKLPLAYSKPAASMEASRAARSKREPLLAVAVLDAALAEIAKRG
jgi:hypothetical protein